LPPTRHLQPSGRDRGQAGVFVQRACGEAENARAIFGGHDAIVDRRQLESAAALLRLPSADVADDQASHHARGIGHEPRAIRKHGDGAAGDVQIRLVEQRGRAQRRLDVPGELAAREPVQLRVERREQRFGGARVAAIRRGDDRADLGQRSSMSTSKCGAARILLSRCAFYAPPPWLDRK
jgi:hypothetical protein